jgi:hypothetical protein
VSTYKRTLKEIQKKLDKGLKREPEEFIYIDRSALYEHFKAATGMSRIPVSFSESAAVSASAGISGFQIGISGGETTNFDLSEPHLFEALEPFLREKYPDITNEGDVISTLKGFGWLSGGLNAVTVRSTEPVSVWDNENNKYVSKERIRKRSYYGLDVESHILTVLCNTRWFSPFYLYLSKDTDIHNYSLNVEMLGYNSSVVNLDNFSTGRSLVFVPTVILVREARTPAEMAEWIKSKNEGEVSRMFGLFKSTRDKLSGRTGD